MSKHNILISLIIKFGRFNSSDTSMGILGKLIWHAGIGTWDGMHCLACTGCILQVPFLLKDKILSQSKIAEKQKALFQL